MEHLSDKFNIGWFIGVLLRKYECQLKDSAFPDRVLGSENNRLPLEYVVVLGDSRYPGLRRILRNLLEVAHQTTTGRC